MEKSKTKRQPRNFFHYFVDEFILFRREFYFESNRLPKQIARNIKAMHSESGTSHIIPSLEGDEDSIEVKIITKEIGKTFITVTAELIGTIYYNADRVTIIEGHCKMTGANWPLIIFFLLLGIFTTMGLNQYSIICLLLNFLLYLLVAVSGWVLMYTGRNELYDRIRDLSKLVDENDDQAKTS